MGLASVAGYALRFHKSSKDGSGTATLMPAKDETVYGVLFEIAEDEQKLLDRAEGRGYGYDRDDAFAVRCLKTGKEIRAATYLAAANAINASLVPFDWYRALVIAGATQHGLPDDYIATSTGVAARPDPDLLRNGRRDPLAALEAADFGHLLAPTQKV